MAEPTMAKMAIIMILIIIGLVKLGLLFFCSCRIAVCGVPRFVTTLNPLGSLIDRFSSDELLPTCRNRKRCRSTSRHSRRV